MREGLYRFKFLISPQAAMDLERLHPGEEREKLLADYCFAKLKKTLLIVLAGTALAVLLAARAASERALDPGNRITREPAAGCVKEWMVEAVIGEEKEKFVISVQPAQLSNEEADELCGRFCAELPALIAGENDSLEEVRKDLYLEETFEGYPFTVEWRSSDVDALTSAGAVKPSDGEREVVLTADISYGEQTWTEQFRVKVPPALLTDRERQHRELEAFLVEAESGSRRDLQWSLPDVWQGEEVKWSKTVDDYSGILWLGSLAAAMLVFFLADRDLHGEVEGRKAKMKLEYPDIVHKLVLYLGAGLTLRGAFQKIAAEYEQGRRDGEPEKAAYEEILYTCRELQAGVSEASAYEHFGKRTGLQEYIRLTTLLSQNLKKGNSTLLQRLREEADRAATERIQSSRRLGEEASTKLLFPMVMMLAVVMVMVMLPAITSMGV